MAEADNNNGNLCLMNSSKVDIVGWLVYVYTNRHMCVCAIRQIMYIPCIGGP